jgi:ABC-2 type transport system ATP-binding protein
VPDDLTTTLHRLTGWALEQHVDLTGLEVIRPSLEDVYLELTDSPPGPAGTGPASPKPASPEPDSRAPASTGRADRKGRRRS